MVLHFRAWENLFPAVVTSLACDWASVSDPVLYALVPTLLPFAPPCCSAVLGRTLYIWLLAKTLSAPLCPGITATAVPSIIITFRGVVFVITPTIAFQIRVSTPSCGSCCCHGSSSWLF